MLSLCNMLIVNFVPLPNFGEINIDKNFSFIYLICLCLPGPARARHNPRVTKYGHHSPPLSLSSGPRHQSPVQLLRVAATKTTSAPHPEAAACRRPAPVRRRSSNVTVGSRLAAAEHIASHRPLLAPHCAIHCIMLWLEVRFPLI